MAMVEQGRVYNNAMRLFFDSVSEMGKHFKDDVQIKVVKRLSLSDGNAIMLSTDPLVIRCVSWKNCGHYE